MSERQKYRPVQNVSRGKAKGYSPKRLAQSQSANQETPRMKSAHIPVVNPVTPGDRSVAMNSCRVYEKGKKNRTRS